MMCRACGSHEETDTLHVLCCENANLHVCRQEIINDLRLKMLGIADEDLTPLCHLQWLFQEDEMPEMPGEAHEVIKRVDRRNIWHGFVPAVLSR